MKGESCGKVVSEFWFLSIEVIKMQKEDYISDPRYADMKTASRTKMLSAKKKIGSRKSEDGSENIRV
ncbi:MAG: hypothetical protein WBN59_07240 [Flavobacteriaceae bacterium]